MLVQRDDVLVRGLRVVLRRRAKKEKMQIELARVPRAERLEDRRMSARAPFVRARETRYEGEVVKIKAGKAFAGAGAK